MSENFLHHFDYEVKSPKLLSPISCFWFELVALCRKHDPNFPEIIEYISFDASPGKLVEWKVQAVEFANKEKT